MQEEEILEQYEEYGEEEQEENSEFEKIIYVDELDDAQVTNFITQSTNFWSHITTQRDPSYLKRFEQVKFDNQPDNYVILTTNHEPLKNYSFLPQIQEKLNSIFTAKIRVALGCDDEVFSNVLRPLILSRQSVIITSNSFQHRQQTREIACAAIVSYLIEKFGHVSLFHQSQLKKQMREAREEAQMGTVLDELSDQSEDESSNPDEINRNEQFNGFARPQVLILTSSRHHAWRIVSMLLELFPDLTRKNIGRFRRFEEDCAPDNDVVQFEVAGQSLLPDEIPDMFHDKVESKKPLEWMQHFVGDNDNEFHITLNIHKRGPHATMLFNNPDKSDVIIASPLGVDNLNENVLNSFHTVFIDSIDYIIDAQFPALKRTLQKLHRMPKIIQNQNIKTISELYLNGVQQTGCQFIAFQAQENEIVNGLFNDEPEFPVQQFEEDTVKENVKERKIYSSCNSFGLFKLKLLEEFKDGPKFKAVKTSGFLNIFDRKTDLLPYGALKFDLTQHPKIDYTVNKLVSSEDQPPTVIYTQNIFQFLRLKSVLQKTKLAAEFLSEDTKPEEIGKKFADFRNGICSILLINESFQYQRRPKILCEKLIFAGPPQYKQIFEELCEWCSGEIWMLHDETDSVRLQNILKPKVAEAVMRARVWEG
ncbi:Conserved_hypothetical protein [Hexamita inflata]|uniref:Uncharacterized protein n=1 Tax=Hexamita inflata TaxID=28002 RepID=A0AA86UBI4_9EUKA|nr:Conserved hypothetical protein [Hexamita inflata]